MTTIASIYSVNLFAFVNLFLRKMKKKISIEYALIAAAYDMILCSIIDQ